MHSTAYLWLKVYRYSEYSSQGFQQDRSWDSLKAKKNSTQTSLVAVKKRLHDLIAYAQYAVPVSLRVKGFTLQYFSTKLRLIVAFYYHKKLNFFLFAPWGPFS